MDFDIGEFTEDKIKIFLQSKLEEIHLQNEDLEKVLQECQTVLNGPNDDCMDDKDLKLSVPSKKIFQQKYNLGFTLETNSGIIEDFCMLLKWDSSQTFIYTICTFCKGTHIDQHLDYKCKFLEPSYNNLSGTIFILVTFDIPEYVYKTQYEISGVIHCKVDNQFVDLLIPKILISSSDFVSHPLQDWVLRKLDFDSLLTIISCSNKVELVMVLPEKWTSSIDSTLEIHCSLTKIEQELKCKDFFVAYKVSQIFDNSLVSVHKSETNVYFINIYTTSNEKLLSFVHYLHSCVLNLLLFPKNYYKNYITNNNKFSNELLQKFRESLTKEIDFVQDTDLAKVQQNFKMNNFRDKLCDIELITDDLYTQICNMNY